MIDNNIILNLKKEKINTSPKYNMKIGGGGGEVRGGCVEMGVGVNENLYTCIAIVMFEFNMVWGPQSTLICLYVNSSRRDPYWPMRILTATRYITRDNHKSHTWQSQILIRAYPQIADDVSPDFWSFLKLRILYERPFFMGLVRMQTIVPKITEPSHFHDNCLLYMYNRYILKNSALYHVVKCLLKSSHTSF